MSDIRVLIINNFDCGDSIEINWHQINKYINETDLTYINEYLGGQYNDYTLIILSNRELTDEEMKQLDDAGITQVTDEKYDYIEIYAPNFDFLLYKINEEKEMY